MVTSRADGTAWAEGEKKRKQASLTKTRSLCVMQIKQRPIDIKKSRTPATQKDTKGRDNNR